MCITDPQPTCYGLEPVKLTGAVTELEQAALKSVDIAEAVSEPVNRFNLARAGVRLAAAVARKLRKNK